MNDVWIKNIMNDMETRKDGEFFNLKSKMVCISWYLMTFSLGGSKFLDIPSLGVPIAFFRPWFDLKQVR